MRFGYPQAFVELTILLALRHGRRNCARVMGLPLSTVYRWLEECRREPDRLARIERGGHEWMDGAIAACEAHGFDVRQRICILEPHTADSGVPAGHGDLRPGFLARVPARAGATPTGGGAPVPTASMKQSSRSRAMPLSPAVLARVALARAEIDRRYYSRLSCEMLAGAAGMSRFHFIRTFKAAFSVAPYHYLMQVRVHRARLLLTTTQQPLDAVAAAVGFDTQSSLCKAFRSVEGISLARFFHGVRLGSSPPRVLTSGQSHAAIG